MSYEYAINISLFFMVCILLLTSTVAFAQQSSGAATTDDVCIDSTSSPLDRARLLRMPQAIDTKDAEFENEQFWNEHGPLIQEAWKEWEISHATTLSDFNDDGKDQGWIIDISLAGAIDEAFANPSEGSETAVKSLWKNNKRTLPKGVYASQLLSPRGISYLRHLFDQAAASGIPTRRPNGMNRNGAIVDSNIYGAVPVQPMVKAVEEIIDRILRPAGRMLYQDRIGCDDDLDYYAFTIKYDGSENESCDDDTSTSSTRLKDIELKEHRDASVVTLNVNLNLPEEDFAGSEVFFRGYPAADGSSSSSDFFATNPNDGHDGTVAFSPGMAIIHLGAHRHGSLPITTKHSDSIDSEGKQKSGCNQRFNLVIWLFGRNGDVRIAPYLEEEQMTADQRWHGCNKGRMQ